MQKEIYRKIAFYLYNYNNIDNLINERKENIVDSINVSNRAWLNSKNSEGYTLEDQVIKLNEDAQIIEYKRWQVFIKRMLVFLCKFSPITYQYLVLKYFEQLENDEIIKSLKIDFKTLIIIKNNLYEFMYKNAKLCNLI